MKKYQWVIASIVFVTVAQLLLRLAMQGDSTLFSFTWLTSGAVEIYYLLLGLISYVLSLFSWVQALRHLSLSHAYPLLSISYILVWASSFFLPSEQQLLSWQAVLGLGFIVSGVCLIVSVRPK
ncbi:undecaprenyl phosphate-alpha-L-ara4N flippase subunit ArnF [Rosenbergiella nectarea]|uniref:Undecaprenyl phosphate-alpha-L-ara4N flippase subunit ArnF n=1 Tax=Rosenbergiella nectarea TaxID=988801 RepID=A0A1H9D361_9GAMM|nr:hypothetical protein [Rosenbergiella nectarea]SEQ07926.1 undecaprenyl phosphate-alpha-L-ara4N flippase subunit ArnF [Rosenbergiella nectarea]